jgi:inner membrane protein
MDNLTHSLAGAALGRAGLYGRSGLSAAALIIGANLPDIDVLGLPFGQNLAFRRGITHGPIAMLVLPLLLTAALLAWSRLRSRRRDASPADIPVRADQLLMLSYIGVLSHPALDWLNNYGVRLLMPFSERWFYGDSIFIIDPWIWIALGAGVWMARRRGRLSLEGAARPARMSIVAVGAYIALMLAGSRYAHRFAHDHVAAEGNGPPRRVMAGPVPINPLERELIVDMGDRYRIGRLTFLPSVAVTLDGALPVNADLPEVRAARDAGAFRNFLYWSRFPHFTVERSGDSARVTVSDVRFANRGGITSSFSESVVVPASR